MVLKCRPQFKYIGAGAVTADAFLYPYTLDLITLDRMADWYVVLYVAR